MNKCVLVGNLTRDPELTVTSSGISVCKMSIAVNRNFTKADGERECDFINIVAWRGLADNCGKYLSKGKKIAVSGAIQSRSYDNTDGEKRYITEVIADDIEFLTPKDSGSEPAPVKGNKKSDLIPVESDDLPF